MEGLSQEQLDDFKNKLVERRQSVEGQLQTFAKKNSDIKNDYETVFEQVGDSEEENADEVATYEEKLAIEHEMEDDLQDIDEALERIKNGTYGICTNCGQNIDAERLRAIPEAKFCIKCEE
ncbi:MAG: TraR/DksA C4-type zinc finger protein [Candidatus Pacebacteria bacterium]|nr:TraR/DksA C4-type zinc finger protein [Candidatus Paceibacterota bacterium]